MIDGGGLAWKWTRKWVPASESRLVVSACEWPAGWPWPGRAPSAERVRGTTFVWRAGVLRYTIPSTRAVSGRCHSLITDSPTVPCAHSRFCNAPHDRSCGQLTMCLFLLKQPTGAFGFDLAMNLCVQQPWPKPGQRLGFWTSQSAGQ